MKAPVLILIILLATLVGAGLVAAAGYFYFLPQVQAELSSEAADDDQQSPLPPMRPIKTVVPRKSRPRPSLKPFPSGRGPLYFEFAKPLLISLDSQADAKYLQLSFTVLVRHRAWSIR